MFVWIFHLEISFGNFVWKFRMEVTYGKFVWMFVWIFRLDIPFGNFVWKFVWIFRSEISFGRQTDRSTDRLVEDPGRRLKIGSRGSTNKILFYIPVFLSNAHTMLRRVNVSPFQSYFDIISSLLTLFEASFFFLSL